MVAKFRKYIETKSDKCKFVVRDGNCEQCPHIVADIKNKEGREPFKPICYEEPSDEQEGNESL